MELNIAGALVRSKSFCSARANASGYHLKPPVSEGSITSDNSCCISAAGLSNKDLSANGGGSSSTGGGSISVGRGVAT